MKRLLLPLLLIASVPIHADDLEKLFTAGPGASFFLRARPLAEQGDVEALFLLGKAYHLGKGVDRDLAEAERLYGLAALKHHPRSLHNLGLIRLDHHRDREGARALLKRALDLGLATPTLFNLGRAYDQAEMTGFDSPEDLATASRYYFRAYETTQDPEALDSAVAASVKATVAPRSKEDPVAHEARLQAALRLGRLGAEKGRSRCLQNLGALYYYQGDYASALPWMRKAADLDQPTALYGLGEMHAKGLGVDKDAEAALSWFERASALGHAEATREVSRHWSQVAEHQEAIGRLRTAIEHLEAIHGRPTSQDLFLDHTLKDARERLAMLVEIHRNARQPAPLPPGLPRMRFRLLDVPEDQGGIPLSQEEWWIGSLWPEGEGLGRSGVLVKGVADGQGRIQLKPAQAKVVRRELEKGRTLVFHWPGQGRLLRIVETPDGRWDLNPEINAPY